MEILFEYLIASVVLKNIYLKKDSGNKNYQITVAKTGVFKSVGKSKILVLFNGQTINIANNKITNFNFTQSDFILSQFDSDVIIQDKVQETSTNEHLFRMKFRGEDNEILDTYHTITVATVIV